MSMSLPIEQEFVQDDGPDIGTFEAAYDLAMMDTFVTNVARTGFDSFGIKITGATEELAKTTKKVLTPEEANDLYRDVEVPFSNPINEAVAFHLNEEGKKRKFLQQKISENPGGTFYKGAVNLGAGILAHALDPVEFGVGAFAGMALSGVGTVAAAGKFGQGAVKTGQVLSQGFKAQAIEGVVGNAVLEPFMYASSKEAQVDYDLEDAFISVVGGGLAAPVAIHGIKQGIHQLSKLSPNSFGLTHKVAVGQLESGKIPEVEPIRTQYDNFRNGEPSKNAELGQVRSSYKFEMVEVDNVKQRPLYTSPNTPNTLDSGSRIIGDYQGDGVYLTDNPNIANNAAANPLDEVKSNVFEMDGKDLNLIDVDAPNKPLLDNFDLPENVKSVINQAQTIKEAQIAIRENIEANKLTDADFDAFMSQVKQNGFDGLKFTDSKVGHNGIFVFKDSAQKIKTTGSFDSDAKAVPDVDAKFIEETKQKVQNKEFQHDAPTQAEFDNHVEFDKLPLEEKKIELEQTINTLKTMEELKLIDDPDDIATINEIISNRKTNEEVAKAMDDFSNCLISGAD